MNIDHIRSLADILTFHGLTSLEVSEGGLNIRLEKSAHAPREEAQPIKTTARPIADSQEKGPLEADSLNFNNLFEVKSPLVGVFYAAPSPDSEPFTHIGAKVKKGDVLCLIEAMKLMNEISAERDGEIADVCLKNGDIAEFGQVLFKIM